ncbi:MAG: thioredoxin family protein [Cyclobacteriaceae bacterium]
MAIQISTDADFEAQLESNNKVIVKYYADWCGTCRLFKPKYRRLSEDEKYEGVSFLDVNAEENENARKLAGVSNLPFFAVFKDGKLVDAAATGKEEKVVELLEKLN